MKTPAALSRRGRFFFRLGIAVLLVPCLILLATKALAAVDGKEIVREATRLVRTAEVGAKVVDCAFKFQNNSGEHVAVAGIEQGCGCLKGEAKFKSVAPGEKSLAAVIQIRTPSRDSRDAVREIFTSVSEDKVAGGGR